MLFLNGILWSPLLSLVFTMDFLLRYCPIHRSLYKHMVVGCQLCPTLCDPMDCSPPGPSGHGISQARMLEWIAISFSRGSSWLRDQTCISCIAGEFFTTEPPGKPTTVYLKLKIKVKVKLLSHVWLFVTPWTVAYQAPPSMGFSRQEYWSGLPFPSPRDLPDPGIKPRSPALEAKSLPSQPPGRWYILSLKLISINFNCIWKVCFFTPL